MRTEEKRIDKLFAPRGCLAALQVLHAYAHIEPGEAEVNQDESDANNQNEVQPGGTDEVEVRVSVAQRDPDATNVELTIVFEGSVELSGVFLSETGIEGGLLHIREICLERPKMLKRCCAIKLATQPLAARKF